MSKLDLRVRQAHQALDNALLRALSMLLALMSAGLVMWDPAQFAEEIGGFGPMVGPALIWATCTGMIHGVGFTPNKWLWQLLFTPYLSYPVLVTVLTLWLL